MPKIFKNPEHYDCPECGSTLSDIVDKRGRRVMCCFVCLMDYEPSLIIAEAMREQGIEPKRDWDDNL